MEIMEVISPVGGETVEEKPIAPRLADLRGKTICETWNEDFKGDFMFPIYRELLNKQFPDIKVIPYTEFPSSPFGSSTDNQQKIAKQIADLAKQKGCDALISGNGG